MNDLDRVETLPVKEVAGALGIAPMKVKSAILNGTMPIGAVARGENSSKDRIVIIAERYRKWIAGEL